MNPVSKETRRHCEGGCCQTFKLFQQFHISLLRLMTFSGIRKKKALVTGL